VQDFLNRSVGIPPGGLCFDGFLTNFQVESMVLIKPRTPPVRTPGYWSYATAMDRA